MALDGGPLGPFIEAANDERVRDEHPAVIMRELDARRRRCAGCTGAAG